MKRIIEEYILNGTYKKQLFYPNDECSTIEYTNNLRPLAEAIRKENPEEVFDFLMLNSRKNVFVSTFVISCISKYNKRYSEFLINETENKYDVFAVFNLLKANRSMHITRYMNDIADAKPYIFENMYGYFENRIFLNLPNKQKMITRQKIITKLQKKLADGSFGESELSAVIRYEIHFNELGYYLSYTFSPIVKHKLFCYFLDKFKIGDLIYCIDKTFLKAISPDLLLLIGNKLREQGTFEDFLYLMIYINELSNYSLKSMIEEMLNSIDYKSLAMTTKNKCPFEQIKIFPNTRYYTSINNQDKVQFIHCIAVFASLLSEIYDKQLFVVDKEITGQIGDKIKVIDATTPKLDYTATDGCETNDCIFASNLLPSRFTWDVLSTASDISSGDNFIIKGINIKAFVTMFFTDFCGIAGAEF